MSSVFSCGGLHVMAIVNVTPDSFYDSSCDDAVLSDLIRRAILAGATIIDIGGYSSRPGAADVTVDEEWQRVRRGVLLARGVIEELSADVWISVDTFRSSIVRRVWDLLGCSVRFIVNDITGGEISCGGDDDMLSTVGSLCLPYIAMHMRGTPRSMSSMTDYEGDGGVVEAVLGFFERKVAECRAAGIEDLFLDPGFGFAKSLDQNYELLRGLDRLCSLGYPVLAGLSRKSMIYKVLGCGADGALAGTVALCWEALMRGATVLRVHDVVEAVDCVKLYERYMAVSDLGSLKE